jgi:hypothetical protein
MPPSDPGQQTLHLQSMYTLWLPKLALGRPLVSLKVPYMRALRGLSRASAITWPLNMDIVSNYKHTLH